MGSRIEGTGAKQEAASRAATALSHCSASQLTMQTLARIERIRKRERKYHELVNCILQALYFAGVDVHFESVHDWVVLKHFKVVARCQILCLRICLLGCSPCGPFARTQQVRTENLQQIMVRSGVRQTVSCAAALSGICSSCANCYIS